MFQRHPVTPRLGKYGQVVKDQGEDVHGAHLHPAFEARYPPTLLPLPVPTTNFAPVGGRARTTPKDADESVTPAEGPKQRNATPPCIQSQTFALIKIDLGTCYFFVSQNRLLHRQYVQSARNKDSDIIGVRRDLRPNPSGKGDSIRSRISLLIPKPMEQGLQSKDVQNRRQRATLPDRRLDREHPRTLSVHLHHCLQVMVHANPFVELQFEFSGVQNRRQKPIIHPVEGLGLI